MKAKIQRAVSCLLFAVLLAAAVAKCADVLEHKDARIKYTPFYDSKTNFDVIFLGTSNMWNHVLPMEMWKQYGIASYNWGYANCTPAENYYLLREIIKYTSPKVVVMDVYGIMEYNHYENGKYKTDAIEQQHVQFDSLPFSINKIAAARDVFDNYENNEDFLWNFIMYHNRWTELGKQDFEYDITTEKGASFLTGLGTASFSPIPENEYIPIDSVCYPYFLGTIEYCMEQGIEVLCVSIPFAAGVMQQKIANSIGGIVEEYPNCSYVNMLTKDIVDYNTDVCFDNKHLNYSGAKKVTAWLGRYLADHYSLGDYGSDSSWKEDYAAYREYKRTKLLEQSTLAAYLIQLTDDDYSVEAEISNSSLLDSEMLTKLFDNARIKPVCSESGSESCARLIVRDKATGELIEDASFVCDDTDDPEPLTIHKAVP